MELLHPTYKVLFHMVNHIISYQLICPEFFFISSKQSPCHNSILFRFLTSCYFKFRFNILFHHLVKAVTTQINIYTLPVILTAITYVRVVKTETFLGVKFVKFLTAEITFKNFHNILLLHSIIFNSVIRHICPTPPIILAVLFVAHAVIHTDIISALKHSC